jgi:crotonobetainyl-CoA:carnitine CoA-transferase CaiB-like acyl-CoA transferase
MYAASNVTTEAATYEWLVAQATVQRQTFRHAAVRTTPQRMMPSVDGNTVIGALPRRATEFQALREWMIELGLDARFDEFFFLQWGVERGGVQLPEIAEPEAAAIYQAGAEGLRIVAAHLPGKTFFLEAQRRQIPAALLYATEDVLNDEHFVAHGFPVEIRHEDLGRTFLYPGPAIRSTVTTWGVRGRAPHVDEHAEQVWRGKA